MPHSPLDASTMQAQYRHPVTDTKEAEMQDDTMEAATHAPTTREDWLRQLSCMGDEEGYFEPLGPHHWALFSDDGPQLLVTFESLDNLRARREGDMPVCHSVTKKNGWSHLCVLSEGETWYRDRRVWRYFDRLIDDGFFEDFDRVTFYGAGLGGHAACAFSVAAPGSTVLAIRPVATLDPAIAPWDRRHVEARRLDFRSRYGYAPDMIDGAAEVFIVHDPHEDEDAMHAALFRKPFTRMLRCPHLGPEPETALAHMGLLAPLMEAAGNGTLNEAQWRRLWRKRRENPSWLRGVAMQLSEGPQRLREAVFLRAALEQTPDAPRLKRRWTEVERELGAAGRMIPPLRSGRQPRG